jgi:site-specific recombinase XerD
MSRTKNRDVRVNEYFTDEQRLSLQKSARTVRDELIVLLSYRHGLRVSELVNLKWAQFDFAKKLVKVFRVKNGTDSIQPVSDEEIALLQKLERSGEYLFINPDTNKPISTRQVDRIIKELGERAELGFIAHHHMLRHSVGMKLTAKGVDLRGVQGFLGHKSLHVTLTYAHLLEDRFIGMGELL